MTFREYLKQRRYDKLWAQFDVKISHVYTRKKLKALQHFLNNNDTHLYVCVKCNYYQNEYITRCDWCGDKYSVVEYCHGIQTLK